MIATAARDAGVPRLVHVSTASVYARTPQTGPVDESSPLVGDDADDYALTKRDTDVALSRIDGITIVLVRPPVILGSSPQSMWNVLRPTRIRDDEDARKVVPDQTFAWVHVDDLAAMVADLAAGSIASSDDPADGPVEGGCTAVNVVGAGHATFRDYQQVVCDVLGVKPHWQEAPAWTGRYLAERARAWGWRPTVGLDEAFAELERDVRSASGRD